MSATPATRRWLGAVLFTLLVPGTVTVVLPYLILGRSFDAAAGAPLAVRSSAWLLIIVGVGLYLRCLWDFVVAGRGIPAPVVDHPKSLVVSGLYRYVRNPMYLGVLAVLVGEVLLFRSTALLGYTVAWLLIVHVFVRFHEEPYLRKRFGASYEQYHQNVRRWIPGRPWRQS